MLEPIHKCQTFNYTLENKKQMVSELLNFEYYPNSFKHTGRLFKKYFQEQLSNETCLDKKIYLILRAKHIRSNTPILNYVIQMASDSHVLLVGTHNEKSKILRRIHPLKLLMNIGADPNTNSFLPPLFEAVRSLSYLEIFIELLDAGADYTRKIKINKAPFNNENLDIVELAVRAYFNPVMLDEIIKTNKLNENNIKISQSFNIPVKPFSYRDCVGEFNARMKALAEHRALKENYNIYFSLGCRDPNSTLSQLTNDVCLLILQAAAKRVFR